MHNKGEIRIALELALIAVFWLDSCSINHQQREPADEITNRGSGAS